MGRGKQNNVLYEQKTFRRTNKALKWFWLSDHITAITKLSIKGPFAGDDLEVIKEMVEEASRSNADPRAVSNYLAAARVEELTDTIATFWPQSEKSFVIQIIDYTAGLMKGEPGSREAALEDIAATLSRLEQELAAIKEPDAKALRGCQSEIKALECCHQTLQEPLDHGRCFDLAHRSHRWVMESRSDMNEKLCLQKCVANETKATYRCLTDLRA